MVIVASSSAALHLIRLFLTMAAVLALALPHPVMTGGLGGAEMHMIHAGTAHDRMAVGGATHDPAVPTICAQACTGTNRSQELVMVAPLHHAAVVIWFEGPISAWPTTDPAPAFRPPNLLLVA